MVGRWNWALRFICGWIICILLQANVFRLCNWSCFLSLACENESEKLANCDNCLCKSGLKTRGLKVKDYPVMVYFRFSGLLGSFYCYFLAFQDPVWAVFHDKVMFLCSYGLYYGGVYYCSSMEYNCYYWYCVNSSHTVSLLYFLKPHIL